MNGCVSEELLALSISDDLDAQERISVSAHLAECETCRSVAAELQLSKQFLENAFGEPTEEDLRFVRVAVRRRMNAKPRQGTWLRLAAGTAAAVVLLTSGLVYFWSARQPALPAPTPRNVPLVARRQMETAPSAKPSRRVQLVHGRVHKAVLEAGLASAVLMTNALGKPELKMITNDPNVVILLQMDGYTHAN